MASRRSLITSKLRRLLLALALAGLLLPGCGSTPQPAATATAVTAAVSTEGEATVAPTVAPAGEKRQLSVWTFQPPDDPAIEALIKAFQEKHPDIEILYTPLPEDEYQTKVNTTLTAHAPPDVAIIENKGWMQAGRVVDLTEQLKLWGVDPKGFNPGGVGRITLTGNLDEGIFAIGDFIGGNVLFYNKAMFDAAGLEYPPVDRSLTWPEYADFCRQLGTPSRNPEEAVYGCSVPDWSFGIWSKWLYGEDGQHALDNMNSEAMVEAWNLGTALVREGFAPSGSLMEAFPAGESDMFAQKKIAMTWSDFTEATKYKEQGISFGVAPFWVIRLFSCK
jgi:multiple sugar transport system substrate-binding protein